MSDRFYNFLVRFQRWLPLLGACYVKLASIWGLPFGDKISETITQIAILIAGTIEISSSLYEKKKNSGDISE